MKYTAPFVLRSAHISTIYPYFFRKPNNIDYFRERIATNDEDFLDLDWSQVGSSELMIFCHGLEGSSRSQYVVGMVRTFNLTGVDCLAWNYRGCSGDINLKARTYHGGATDDLETVIQYVLNKFPNYKSIFLMGFSLGGNLVAKYLGEKSNSLHPQIKKAIIYSTPFSLGCSSIQMSVGFGKIYKQNFLRTMKIKIQQREKIYSNLDLKKIYKTKTFLEFDDLFTAPVNGFKDANDYYESCSSSKFIKSIEIPTLSINALNDPFLGEECYPFEEFSKNKNLIFLTPKHGGHLGFCHSFFDSEYWSEAIAKKFILE